MLDIINIIVIIIIITARLYQGTRFLQVLSHLLIFLFIFLVLVGNLQTSTVEETTA